MATLFKALLIVAASSGAIHAQLSSSAYRVLGQTDLRQNGLNLVQGVELYLPSSIALDARGGQTHLYISDTRNSRVMGWADAASYQMGDAPAVVLGQPGPQYSSTSGIGVKGFNSPLGLAVDPLSGNLYVADFNNNRVVRFQSPFANPSRIEPDAVYGQPNFSNRTASAASSTSLNQPRAVAFDPAGNLWVADSGNHRVVRFSAAVLNSPAPVAADTVIGQRDFFNSSANAGGLVSGSGFDTPTALVFDLQANLYVSDGRNSRVLKFSAPLGPPGGNPTASAVWGQSNFASRGVPQQASSSTIAVPGGLAVDGGGNLYVSAPNDNRILVFSTGTTPGGAARNVLGQSDFATTTANTGAFPQASPNSLSGPSDVEVDQNGNVFVTDTANNRVLEFPPNAKSANRVWGQSDFVSNGANQIKPASISLPYQMVIDYSSAPFALYLADTSNHRVLGWKDSAHFRNGDPADLVIGQPNLRTAAANVDTQGSPNPSRTSLSGPTGIAVNPSDGTLFVADSGNNRVLRYPRPVNQSGRISPDVVIGQVDFTSALSAAVNASSLNAPGGLAIGPNGDLFVADSGNNRVLEFPAGAGIGASGIRVFGQPNMTTSARPSQVSPQTLTAPQGIAVDPASNLYVADTGANRVLIFSNTQNGPPRGMAATFVIGQGSFDAASVGSFRAPVGVAVDSNGKIYVADNGNNRMYFCRWPVRRRRRLWVKRRAAPIPIGIRRMAWRRPRASPPRWVCLWTGRTRCMSAMPGTTAWCSTRSRPRW
ncbi:MAG: NHL repeat-containing protein [Candidatus Solibacter sp.]|nr:NHL repeat-containing protein [Candidatus Solibacter sp.]